MARFKPIDMKMSHSIAVLTLCLIQGFLVAAATGSARAQSEISCAWETWGGDHRDFKCPLTATGTTQLFRFKANFSGSHDDTKARMVTTLNGRPLACAAGSKTSLFAEDGDVSLECRFSVTEAAGTEHLLAVTLFWYHAQYMDFELAAADLQSPKVLAPAPPRASPFAQPLGEFRVNRATVP